MESNSNSFVSNDESTPIDPKQVESSLWHLFPGMSDKSYAEDYAQIISFLGDNQWFNEVATQTLDPLVEQQLKNSNGFKPQGKLQGDEQMVQVLYGTLEHTENGIPPSGFHQAPPVYLTGTATGQEFGGVTNNGLLLVDGLSVTHGEYTHSIQWANIYAATLHKNRPLKLKNSVADLYKQAVQTKQDPGYSVLKEQDDPRKKAQGEKHYSNEISMWDYAVDCIPQVDPTTSNVQPDHFPNGEEAQQAHAFTIVSNEPRSPAVVQYKYLFGDLSHSKLGKHMREMYQKRQVLEQVQNQVKPTTEHWLAPDEQIPALVAMSGQQVREKFKPQIKQPKLEDNSNNNAPNLKKNKEVSKAPRLWPVQQKSAKEVQGQYLMQAKSLYPPKGPTQGKTVWLDEDSRDRRLLNAQDDVLHGYLHRLEETNRRQEQRRLQQHDSQLEMVDHEGSQIETDDNTVDYYLALHQDEAEDESSKKDKSSIGFEY